MDAANIQEGTTPTPTYPSYAMLEIFLGTAVIRYVFMFNDVRFSMHIDAKALKGKGDLFDEFNFFKTDLHGDGNEINNFEDWVLNPLTDFLLKIAPIKELENTKLPTLHDYFSPITFAFKLVNKDGNLHPIPEDYTPESHGEAVPKVSIVDTLDQKKTASAVVRSSLPSVPKVPASHVTLTSNDLTTYPRRVQILGSNDILFFKPSFHGGSHNREIELLSQIDSSGKFNTHFRTSKLIALVVLDDTTTCLMGLLLEYIEGQDLASRCKHSSKDLRIKWINQIEATMQQLHQIGLVWGDVKPHNVIIDPNDDAILVDFGGGYSLPYIPRELMNTVEGDLVGLDNTKKEVLGSHISIHYQ